MKKIYGNTRGLKPNQLKKLENFYRRKIPPEYLITQDVARDIGRLSDEIHRQIGLLIGRNGKIIYVIVGDRQSIFIPDISDFRVAPDRLRGLRCVHTHLNQETLSNDDLTDLSLLRLDMMAAIILSEQGLPRSIQWAHILPNSTEGQIYEVQPPLNPGQLNVGCLELIRSLEAELAQIRALHNADQAEERALLLSITTSPKKIARDSMKELEELAASCGITVVGTVIQQLKTINPRYLMGTGKLKELAIAALQKGATLLVFDQDLNPSQIRSITDQIELKVIDRTQLILDIFAQRAQSREGKLQVELAQLKYLQPRLVAKNTAMSRLTGGIGGRGPGETKLEINRRRVRDRINLLEKSLIQVQKQRKQQRSLRAKMALPLISIVGYTNAGKSTLLNALTKSHVKVEDRLFATLDPSNRRLKFPRDMEVIISDTVGFIRNLPKDLMVAFRATLEALEDADLLLHVIDISNPRYAEQIKAVDRILRDLSLHRIPVIQVMNKTDLVEKETLEKLHQRLNGVLISATDPSTLPPLVNRMVEILASNRRPPE